METTEIKELDFKEFHPLDHSIFFCSSPGGRLRHFSLWWQYKFVPQLRETTLCRIGIHKNIEFEDKFIACRYCLKGSDDAE